MNIQYIKFLRQKYAMYLMILGEILRMTHIARGMDSDGALLLDIVVKGHILQLPSNADIIIKVHKLYRKKYSSVQ